MNERYFLPPVSDSVFERVTGDALGAGAGNDGNGFGRGARVVADADVVLDADVQPLGVLADEHQIQMLVTPMGQDRIGRAYVRVEIKRLPQRHVDRAVPLAHRRLERALEGELGAFDGIQRRVRNRVAAMGDAGHAGHLRVPGDVGAGGIEQAHRGLRDRRTDAVARNERDGRRHWRMNRLANFTAMLVTTAGDTVRVVSPRNVAVIRRSEPRASMTATMSPG